MLSLYEKIKIRLIILFLLAALSFIGLFFIINYQLVSERAVKRADSRFELIQKNVGYFFKDIERSALTLKDSLYLLKNTEEIQRAVILKMERLSTSQGGLFLPILTHRNDRGRWLQMTLTTAGIRHTIALIVRVKNVSLLRYVSTAKITIC